MDALVIHAFILFLTVVLSHTKCQAANNYCTNGLTTAVQLDEFNNREEFIIPAVFDERVESRLGYKSCKWTVGMRSSTRKDLQLVVLGMPTKPTPGGEGFWSRNGTSNLTYPVLSYKGKKSIAISPGIFIVKPLREILPLTVEANWDPRTQSVSQVQLRILLVLPGLCDTNMLSHNGSCYAISQVPQSLDAAIASLGGYAEVASFGSQAEINSFVKANADKLLMHPYRRPLSLSQPVRVGLFHRPADAMVLSLVRNDSGTCALKPVSRLDAFKLSDEVVSGPCGSLTASESDTMVLEFHDCRSSMLTLIKFSENATSSSLVDACGIGSLDSLFNRSWGSFLIGSPINISYGLSTTPAAARSGQLHPVVSGLAILAAIFGILVLLTLTGVWTFKLKWPCFGLNKRSSKYENSFQKEDKESNSNKALLSPAVETGALVEIQPEKTVEDVNTVGRTSAELFHQTIDEQRSEFDNKRDAVGCSGTAPTGSVIVGEDGKTSSSSTTSNKDTATPPESPTESSEDAAKIRALFDADNYLTCLNDYPNNDIPFGYNPSEPGVEMTHNETALTPTESTASKAGNSTLSANQTTPGHSAQTLTESTPEAQTDDFADASSGAGLEPDVYYSLPPGDSGC